MASAMTSPSRKHLRSWLIPVGLESLVAEERHEERRLERREQAWRARVQRREACALVGALGHERALAQCEVSVVRPPARVVVRHGQTAASLAWLARYRPRARMVGPRRVRTRRRRARVKSSTAVGGEGAGAEATSASPAMSRPLRVYLV